MAIPVTAVTAVAVDGQQSAPLRRAARRFPGLRLRCSDKAVLPWAELPGETPWSRPLRQRAARGPVLLPNTSRRETNSPRRCLAEGLEPSALPCQRQGGVCNRFR